MKRDTRVRGQTLLLFALTMLLTTLLVLMTLSLSTRVKEKMELDAVADAAAYSNAVVTARAFNEIALLSRAQIGKMVSLAAVQSLISWSSYYRAQVEAARKSYTIAQIPYDLLEASCCVEDSPCPAECACATKAILDISQSRSELELYQQQLQGKWESLDKGAAGQARLLQHATTFLYIAQLERYDRIRQKLGRHAVADDIVDKARAGSAWPNEWSAPSDANEVGQDEAVGIPLLSGLGGAALPITPLNSHHVYAAMGSRGFSFTTMRTMGAEILTLQLQQKLTKPDTVVITNAGSSYFAKTQNHGKLFPSDAFAWADDHAGQGIANTVTFNRGQSPCPPSSVGVAGAFAFLKSTDSGDSSDTHTWNPGFSAEEPERHDLGMCVGSCPSVWPLFVDYNPAHLVTGDDNLWGQPKNQAVIQRDYSQRLGNPDPWALFFPVRFTHGADSMDSQFDARGIRLGPRNGNLDISKQTALSTGLAYYHRHGHWREPPNLLNPYWRATLVPFDVDEDGPKDVRKSLDRAGVSWANEAFQSLVNHGYRGGP
ncbi:pilus assembly protein [Hyalangium versicolor]|uniref:pilus assembly protein n=1 Tax=Hyalangium versicolor TaxID=2861190 RepID=UPI001CC94389|nr:pilus assembly protein [Hyalangium versicolor]